MANRNQKIVRTSLTGIGANILLAGLKFAIGAAANSVAVCADALNNTTDALSFLITIAGVRLSEKSPDKKHPFGYGRIEYLSSLLIGIIMVTRSMGIIKKRQSCCNRVMLTASTTRRSDRSFRSW